MGSLDIFRAWNSQLKHIETKNIHSLKKLQTEGGSKWSVTTRCYLVQPSLLVLKVCGKSPGHIFLGLISLVTTTSCNT